jgi:ankyrin repeat protein
MVFMNMFKDGWTALMKAADKGRSSVVKLLLEHGADPSVRDKVSIDNRSYRLEYMISF